MKLGIMQPYFFPYLGYYQLINAVDKYVIYDDVNYINRGWINRNRILINYQSGYFNLPIKGASQNKYINQLTINNTMIVKQKMLTAIKIAYAKAPYFSKTYELLQQIIEYENKNLAKFLINSIKITCDYLHIHTDILISSQLAKNSYLKGQDKILNICGNLQATEYYNAINGEKLYDYQKFTENGIKLHFLQMNNLKYPQFKNEFVPNLSIIDVMMFNSIGNIQKMLDEYTLVI